VRVSVGLDLPKVPSRCMACEWTMTRLGYREEREAAVISFGPRMNNRQEGKGKPNFFIIKKLVMSVSPVSPLMPLDACAACEACESV
jgi:hypothetical protein